MSLRDQASADLRRIVEDSAGGFGVSVTVTDPQQSSASLTGFSTDIGTTIEPETQQAVVGRQASVALPIKALTEAGLAIPRAIADENQRPWLVSFTDFDGNTYTYKVQQAMPDRAIGVVTCMLESWRALQQGVLTTHDGQTMTTHDGEDIVVVLGN